MDWVDKPPNYKDLYGILQLLRFSHLNNFQLKTLKLGWVAFHSVTFQLKFLDFQSNQYKKLVPVVSRFCNGLLTFLARRHFAVFEKFDTCITSKDLLKRIPLAKFRKLFKCLGQFFQFSIFHLPIIHSVCIPHFA